MPAENKTCSHRDNPDSHMIINSDLEIYLAKSIESYAYIFEIMFRIQHLFTSEFLKKSDTIFLNKIQVSTQSHVKRFILTALQDYYVSLINSPNHRVP